MEIEVSLKQWNVPVEQLEESLKLLERQDKELETIQQSMSREFHGEEWTAVRKNIREKEEMLKEQVLHLFDMKIAMEKIRRLYEDCEETVIGAGEENRIHMPETLAIQDLGPWNLIPFQLKAGEE